MHHLPGASARKEDLVDSVGPESEHCNANGLSSPAFGLTLGSFRLIILVAQIMILVTRMIAQIYKNTKETTENTHRRAAAPSGAAAGGALFP